MIGRFMSAQFTAARGSWNLSMILKPQGRIPQRAGYMGGGR